MLKSALIASVCAAGLLAAPVMAAGTAAPSHSAATPGTSAGKHYKATHVATGPAHGTRPSRSIGRASAQDRMADQLNAQSLQAAMQGRPYDASGAGGGAAGAPRPAPTARP
jgi:hypothetical protein